jgi:hypothetical protein
MAILTKAQLEALNQSSFPDQSTEAITPAILRNYNTQTIDTLVDSLDTGSFTTDAEFNAFTSSTNSSITQLNASSASQQISINALNGATSSYATSAITASSLVTASFSGNTLTFTKGDSSTFGVVIPDISGSTIPAGTVSSSAQIVNYGIFAITGSNQFIGNQAIDGTLTITGKIIGSQSIFLQPNANDARTLEIYNTSAADTHITASGGELFLGNDETYVLVNTNANQKLVVIRGDEKIVASGSLDISGSLTASLANGFTYVGNGSNRTTLVATSSFGTPIPSGTVSSSAQILNYNIFATTGSNAFFGTNTFSGAVSFTGSAPSILSSSFSGSLITNLTDVYTDVEAVQQIVTLTSASYAALVSGSLTNPNTLYLISGSIGSSVPAGTISSSAQITSLGFVSSSVTASSLITASFSGNTLTFTKGDSSTFGVLIPDVSGSTINTGSFATTGSNTFTGKQIIDGYQNAIALTGSQSYIDLSGELAHISLYAGTGSIRFYTGSANGTGASDIGTYVNMQVNPLNGALAISQFPYNNHFVDFDVATTSSIFTAPIKLADTTTFGTQTTILSKSGSLVFIANALDTIITNISASTNTQLNLILKTANNQSASLTISGSNNLIGLATAPTTGFKRYITSNNIALGGNLPQITGSATYSPTISANLLNGELTFRGPASSSAWTINNNILNNAALRIGNADATSANQAAAGGTIGSNILLSTVNYNAYTTPLVVSANFNRNLAVGTDTTLTAFSSSITSNSNIFNGQTFAVNNSYFGTASTNAAQRLQLSFNVLGGINSSILTASGSNTTTSVAREVIANTTNGSGILLGVVLSGDNSSLLSTLVHGSNLTVTGSSANNNYTTAGGAFIGRNNSVNGTAASSGETIFAVGTGTSTSVRKTGFLIDSGSNTFVEGTLNVSGSSSFTGSVKVASTFQLQLPTGSNQQAGTAVLDGGNPGAVTVSNSLVTANSIIMVSKQTLAHPNGYVAVSSKGAGTFTITSNHNGDTDTVGWFIINNS